jgi:hypothetical protein
VGSRIRFGNERVANPLPTSKVRKVKDAPLGNSGIAKRCIMGVFYDDQGVQTAVRPPNPEQKRGVDTVEGPVMVIAGPGTGKTLVLILRIANILLNAQIEPENILVLTFTESAAYEMRKRLVSPYRHTRL